MNAEQHIKELERTLQGVNSKLGKILPAVTDPEFSHADVRQAVVEAEKQSRWNTTPLPGDPEGYDFAVARAQLRAKEQGEPFVVAQDEDGSTVLVMPKSRFQKEHPFDLSDKDVIYDTSAAETR